VLAGAFGGVLSSEVDVPDCSVLGGGVGEEAVIAAEARHAVVGGTSLQHVGMVAVEGGEGSRELFEGQASVSIIVVTSDPELELIARRVHTTGVQSSAEVMGVNYATVVGVENLERIRQVEISLEDEVGFSGFEGTLL